MIRKFNLRRREPVYSAMEKRMLRQTTGNPTLRTQLLLAMALGYYAKEYEGGNMRFRSHGGALVVEVYTTKTDEDVRHGPSWYPLHLGTEDWRKVLDNPRARTYGLIVCEESYGLYLPSPAGLYHLTRVPHGTCLAPAFIWMQLGEVV
jgi:hypothetical protein